MLYKADLHSELSGKRIVSVEFDDEYLPGCKRPETIEFQAKGAAAKKGVRNTQFLKVRNLSPVMNEES